ncbi:hypothetical protein DFH28DRAFT_1083401 [Melampsora americana]|nr:hypothetical protein DFH28DRAFT_1083401 [Melampsora americana]
MSHGLQSDKAEASNVRSSDLRKEKRKSSDSSKRLNGTRPHVLTETSMKPRSETTPPALPSNSGLLDDPIVIGDSDESSSAVYSALVDQARIGEASASKRVTLQPKRQISNACSSSGSSSRSALAHKKDKGSHSAKAMAHIGGVSFALNYLYLHPMNHFCHFSPQRVEATTTTMPRPRPDAPSPRDRTDLAIDPSKSAVSPQILPADGGSQARPYIPGLTARKTTSANWSRHRNRASASASTSSVQHINPNPRRYLCALPAPKLPPKLKPPSPDWSRVPTYFRPSQGPERPGEFETSLQLTWLREKKPDLLTPLGNLIYRENINSRQMWENPEIPQIEVVVPDNVKLKMDDQALAPPLEFIYTDRIVYRTEETPIPPIWKCDCHGDCRNSARCACREYQEKKIRDLARELAGDPEAQALAYDFSGFAYESDRRPLHSHKKSPDNAETDNESRLVKKLFLDAKLPIFECNAQVSSLSWRITKYPVEPYPLSVSIIAVWLWTRLSKPSQFVTYISDILFFKTVGRGRREKLNLQKTLTRGWGVFVDQTVTHGRLVAHYSGELITTAAQEHRSDFYDRIGRTYIFSLDPWWIKTLGGGQELDEKGYLEIHTHNDSNKNDQRPNKLVEDEEDNQEVTDDTGVESLYAMDAFWYGNISRFINHSCAPNTTIIPIYINDEHLTFRIFAMFANKMIKNGHEVTASYSDPTSHEEDRTGGTNKTRVMRCECGTRGCAKVMFI